MLFWESYLYNSVVFTFILTYHWEHNSGEHIIEPQKKFHKWKWTPHNIPNQYKSHSFMARQIKLFLYRIKEQKKKKTQLHIGIFIWSLSFLISLGIYKVAAPVSLILY